MELNQNLFYKIKHNILQKDKENKTILLKEKFNLNVEEDNNLTKIAENFYLLYSFMHNRLQELFPNNNLAFSIGIAGGAIRDTVTNNFDHIKDLDIYINFSSLLPLSQPDSVKFLQNLLPHIEKFSYGISLSNEQYARTLSYELIRKIFEPLGYYAEHPALQLMKEHNLLETENTQFEHLPQNKTINNSKFTEIIEISDEPTATKIAYMNSCIGGVLKTNNELFEYPTDIIIIGQPLSEFIETFDFNICKIYREIQFLSAAKHIPKEQVIDNFINGIAIKTEFVQDFINKQITLNMNLDSVSICRSLKDHYFRIQQKLPNYTLNYDKELFEQQSQSVQLNIMNAQLQKEMTTENLSLQEKNRKKIKI